MRFSVGGGTYSWGRFSSRLGPDRAVQQGGAADFKVNTQRRSLGRTQAAHVHFLSFCLAAAERLQQLPPESEGGPVRAPQVAPITSFISVTTDC